MNKLAEQAIADATALREMAKANAELALHEAFRDRVDDIVNESIDKELSEMEGNDDEVEDEAEVDAVDEADSSEEDDVEAAADSDESNVDEGNKAEEDGEVDDTDDEEAGSENLDEADSSEEEEDEDQMGLDEIIAELEAELETDDEADDEDDDETIAEEAEMDDDDDDDDEDLDESFNIEELLSAIDEMEFDYNSDVNETTELDNVRAELEEVKAERDEYKEAIIDMSSTLTEVNLLNAKLLYANKLFRSSNMTNEQKVKIIETLDRTKNTREVKLVYATLAESMGFEKTKTTKRPSAGIVEGLSSKQVGSTAPDEKTIISEANNSFENRMKTLAGIIN